MGSPRGRQGGPALPQPHAPTGVGGRCVLPAGPGWAWPGAGHLPKACPRRPEVTEGLVRTGPAAGRQGRARDAGRRQGCRHAGRVAAAEPWRSTMPAPSALSGPLRLDMPSALLGPPTPRGGAGWVRPGQHYTMIKNTGSDATKNSSRQVMSWLHPQAARQLVAGEAANCDGIK